MGDRDILQETLDNLFKWAEDWGMQFNLTKCKIMHIGRNNPRYKYTMGGVELSEVEEEKDVGVLITSNLKPSAQCKKAAFTATAVLHQITKNFHFRDRHVFMGLYKQYVRPHLEFSTPAWSPWLRGDKDVLENVQKKAVKMVAGLSGESYEERCIELELDSLEKRRWDQDMRQTFKIIRGIDKLDKDKLFTIREPNRYTRSAEDQFHISQNRARQDTRRYFYSHRVVNGWNNIGYEHKSKSLAIFKNSLKKYNGPGGEP